MEGTYDSLQGYPGADDIGSAAEWLGAWLAMRKEAPPKVKMGWGSERLNRRSKR